MTNFKQTEPYRKHFAVFPRLIGHALLSLARDQYVFNGQADDECDGKLELTFDGDLVITLGIAPDGESVVANPEPLTIQEPFNIDDESRCEWQRVELIAHEPWSFLRGRPLSKVQAVVDHWTIAEQSKQYVAGWHLWFGDDFVGYHNFGDNGKVLFNQNAPPLENVTTTLECVASEHAA